MYEIAKTRLILDISCPLNVKLRVSFSSGRDSVRLHDWLFRFGTPPGKADFILELWTPPPLTLNMHQFSKQTVLTTQRSRFVNTCVYIYIYIYIISSTEKLPGIFQVFHLYVLGQNGSGDFSVFLQAFPFYRQG